MTAAVLDAGVLIPCEVLRQIRAHAFSETRAGFEIGGHLLLDGHRAVEYVPAENVMDEPGFYRAARLPPAGAIAVHSHPSWGGSEPSFQDVAAIRRDRLAMMGIFSAREGLRFWRDGGRRANLPRDRRVLTMTAFAGFAIEVPYRRSPVRRR